MDIVFSIIIPHKNTPCLLQRCVNSIPSRDDVQIIIVDDNSSPEKVNFEDFPGKNRGNTICIFDKSGKGAGHARNVGLQYAQGKWIIFSDADDFFTKEFNKILDSQICSSADLTYYDVESVDSDTLLPCNRSENYKGKFYQAIAESNMDLLRYKMTFPWGKIISKALIDKNSIIFDETPVSNDAWFSLMVGYYSAKTIASKSTLYIVTSSNNSLVRQNNVDNIWIRLEIAAKINNFLQENKLEKYHANLFAYEYYLLHAGLSHIYKAFVFSCKNTPNKYIFSDLLNCLKYCLQHSK